MAVVGLCGGLMLMRGVSLSLLCSASVVMAAAFALAELSRLGVSILLFSTAK